MTYLATCFLVGLLATLFIMRSSLRHGHLSAENGHRIGDLADSRAVRCGKLGRTRVADGGKARGQQADHQTYAAASLFNR